MSCRVLLCSFALFIAVASLRKRSAVEKLYARAGSRPAHGQAYLLDSACSGKQATSPISSTSHAVPIEGSELTKMAFSSCYNPSLQSSSALWQDVRTFLPEVFVWLGDNMYLDGTNMEGKRGAYNA